MHLILTLGGIFKKRVTVVSIPGFPTPRIEWRKEGGTLPLQHTVRDGVLLIPRVLGEDAGVYVCYAYNAVGQYEGKAELIVQSELSEM